MQENVPHTERPVRTPEELSELLPEFEVLELIGVGGMGAVYRARQKSLDRVVAIKVLTARSDADAEFTERFEREARTLAGLSHPGIVGVYDFGRAGEHLYIAMELVEGADLRRVMDARAITPREALAIVSQICEALQYAHERGVVHRDIKPGNVLLDRDGHVKITDFGLAKLVGVRPAPALTRTSQVMGTPHYMAPEQMETPLEVDHRADIYSLGVVLYELLTGELPIGNFAPPSQRVQVDVRLDDVVLRALENEPVKRYQSATDVRTDVEEVLAHPDRHRRGVTRRSPALIVAWVAALGLATLAWFLWTGRASGDREIETSSAVKMEDLLVEENGSIVSKTVEFDKAGVPHLSAHFANVFGMDEDNVARADEHLRLQREAYVALVSGQASATWSRGASRVEVTVPDFTRDRSTLAEHTLTLLATTLGGRTIPAPAAQEIERALFPLGVGPSTLQLQLDGAELVLTASNQGLGDFELRGERVFREFGHHLESRAYPPLSALPAVRALLDALDRFDWNVARRPITWLQGRSLVSRRGLNAADLDAEADLDVEVECYLVLQPRSDPDLDPAFRSDLQSRLQAHLSAQPWCVPDRLHALIDLSKDGTNLRVAIDLTARVPDSHGTLHPSKLDLARIPVKTKLDAALAAVLEGLVRRDKLSHDSAAPGLFTQRSDSVLYEAHETAHLAWDFERALEDFEAVVLGGTVTSFAISLEDADGSQSKETLSRLIVAEVTVVTRKAWVR